MANEKWLNRPRPIERQMSQAWDAAWNTARDSSAYDRHRFAEIAAEAGRIKGNEIMGTDFGTWREVFHEAYARDAEAAGFPRPNTGAGAGWSR